MSDWWKDRSRLTEKDLERIMAQITKEQAAILKTDIDNRKFSKGDFVIPVIRREGV